MGTVAHPPPTPHLPGPVRSLLQAHLPHRPRMPHRYRTRNRRRGGSGPAARGAGAGGGRAVSKLAMFRGLYLGDLVAATGALRALHRGHPGAEITLVSRSEEHTSELQSRQYLVCRLLLEKKKLLPREQAD